LTSPGYLPTISKNHLTLPPHFPVKYQRHIEVPDVPLLETLAWWAAGYSHFALYVTSATHFDCAVGAVQSLEISRPEGAWQALEQFQQQSGRRIAGYLGYDLKNDLEALTSAHPDSLAMPVAAFFLPEIWIRVRGATVSFDSTGGNMLNDALDTLRNPTPFVPRRAPRIALVPSTTREQYIEAVQALRRHLHRGDIYEVNYCIQFHGEAIGLSPLHRFIKLQGLTEAPFSVFARVGEHYIMCASPERFLKRDGRTLTSQPIKGTTRRSDDPVQDEIFKATLAGDPKERSENVMITDLVRNDLSRIAAPDSVRVKELFGVYSFKTVHHMISTIEATLGESYTSWHAIKACFPMGSMTGAPKISAMELIERYEHFRRGAYSGAFGWMDPNGDFDFNVMIRTLLFNADSQRIAFAVGSAITVHATPEREYEECMLKSKALRDALDIDQP
jgi:para-aminobenzoate synthetase component 1